MNGYWQLTLAGLLVAWIAARLWMSGKAARKQNRAVREYLARRKAGEDSGL